MHLLSHAQLLRDDVMVMHRKAIRQALDSGESQDIADNLDTLNLLGAASQV